VPVLELDDGSYLSESVAICRYLEGLHPEPNLFGRDLREQAEVERYSPRPARAVKRTRGPYSEKMKRMSGNRTSVPVTKRLKRQCAAHGRQRNVHRGKLKRLGSPLHLEDVPVIS
jgi:glutathione S-transferase